MERRVAIIGAGTSGLLACKYTLEKGFHPIVFEAEGTVGGVWTRTMESTKFQNTREAYCFSDFPWPSYVREVNPSNTQVKEHIESYAHNFGLLPYIKFNSKVTGIDYVGESESEMQSWELWGGTGKPLGSQGKWHVHVQHTGKSSSDTKRWGISKFVESYLRWKLPLNKYGMIPKHSFHQDVSSCQILLLPEKFYDKVDEGSIILKKSPSFKFCREGLIINGEDEPLETDLVILAKGYKGDEKLRRIFLSPTFHSCTMGSPTSTVPLCRQIVHPRIAQLAIIGYSESLSNMYTSEIRCQWLAHFLHGTFELPSIKAMERDVLMWENYMKLYAGRSYLRSCIGDLHIWYNDQLCKDIGCNPRRKKGFFSKLFEPHGPQDYAGLKPQ